MRRHYRTRRNTLISALAHTTPTIKLSGIAGGLHALATLPTDTNINTLIKAAAARGIALTPATRYQIQPRPEPPQLVLSYANLPDTAIPVAAQHLAELLAQAQRASP